MAQSKRLSSSTSTLVPMGCDDVPQDPAKIKLRLHVDVNEKKRGTPMIRFQDDPFYTKIYDTELTLASSCNDVVEEIETMLSMKAETSNLEVVKYEDYGTFWGRITSSTTGSRKSNKSIFIESDDSFQSYMIDYAE